MRRCIVARKKKKKKKYRLFWLFAKIQLVLLLLVLGACAFCFFGGYAAEVQALKTEAGHLVRKSSAATFRVNQTSVVYAADGTVISTLKGGGESYYLERDIIPYDAVSAIISIEDKKFYRHDGVDYRALLRAVKAMIENGEVKQGGSTITMQLARNIFLSQEKTWQRKVEEMFIAWNLEKKYTKDQIIEFYLNNIYFGNGYYGIQSASRGYFNRDVETLNLSEVAFLCAIPNNPTLYDPLVNYDNTIGRRNRILSQMQKDGKISETAHKNAVAAQIVLERPQSIQKNDYVETYTYYCATRALMEQEGFKFRYEFTSAEDETAYDEAYDALYAECQKKLYTGGYEIYTSLDLAVQEQLQASVDGTLQNFTEENDEGVYALQASAVCIDNESGRVKAIVGGRKQDFDGYTLNRAYQSFRQPGSAIKPLIVYTPAFERSYTPESIVVDEPIEDGPKNSNGAYAGTMTLRTAIEKSINTIAWKLYGEITPEQGLSYLREMNFARLDAEDYRLSTALGGFTNGVSALEMASGYAALANDGEYRMPTCIIRITDASGNEVYASAQEEKTVYKQNAARTMTDVLTGVFKSGTARGHSLKNMPCAGKTGTSNDQKDGWFVGYTRYYTTSVWVGYDMPRKLDGLMGSTYPAKIWQTFMEQVHEGLEPLAFLPYAKMSDDFQSQNQQNPQEQEPEANPGQEPEDSWQQEQQPQDPQNPGTQWQQGQEPQDPESQEPQEQDPQEQQPQMESARENDSDVPEDGNE